MARFVFLSDAQWKVIQELGLDQNRGTDAVLVRPQVYQQLENEIVGAGKADEPTRLPDKGGALNIPGYVIGRNATRIETLEGVEHGELLNAVRAALGLPTTDYDAGVMTCTALDIFSGAYSVPLNKTAYYLGRPVKTFVNLSGMWMVEFADKSDAGEIVTEGDCVEIR